MKKKLFLVLMAAVMATSAVACGNSKKEESNTESTKTDDTTSDSTEEESTQVSEADQIEYNVEDYVTLGDYSALQVSVSNTYEVTQEQIDDYAQGMAEYYAQPTYKDTDKTTVEDGDTVNIDYEGKKDGVAFDGGTASGYNLTIGSDSFIDGFEDGLIGKKVGETVDLDLTFPESYQNEELAGAAVVFTVTINKIVEEDTTADLELTDEYVNANFGYETVEDYKNKVKEYLETTNESSKSTDTRQAVIDKLLEISEVTIPDGLLDARVSDYVIQFTNKNCSNTTLAEYLSSNYNGMTEDEFQTEITTEMETNLKTELVLEAIAKQEGIELEEEEFQEYVQEQMTNNSYETEEAFYSANGVNAQSGEKYERKVYVCNQALDLVIENASVKYGVEPENSSTDTSAEE